MKGKRALFIADPIDRLNPAKDTTLLLAEEAIADGWHVFYTTTPDLVATTHDLYATGHWISLPTGTFVDGHDAGPSTRESLLGFDALVFRPEPPFDSRYLTATYMLDRLPRTMPMINRPAGIRNVAEKLWPMLFPDLIGNTMVTWSLNQAIAFMTEMGAPIVLKPLYGFAGKGVQCIDSVNQLRAAWPDDVAALPMMVQPFNAAVYQGEKRLFVINGQLAGGFLKVPPANEFRTNLIHGSTPQPCDITPRDRQIAAAVGPRLVELGIVLAGLDVLDGTLSEVNVTCPTGIRPWRSVTPAPHPKLWKALLS